MINNVFNLFYFFKCQKVKAIKMEIELLSKLNHKNIVRYIGTQQQKDNLNIFLEYAAGNF